MPLDLQRIVGPLKVTGTEDDPLFVIVQGISIITFNKPGSITGIAPSTKTTIVSQVFVADSIENVPLLSASGTNYAKYFFQINAIDIDIRRAAPSYNVEFNFTGAPFSLKGGDIVSIAVEHFNAGNEDFDATIYGYA